jgi:ubiquinone/menaquinone biosynthesis C-methylase UbiE
MNSKSTTYARKYDHYSIDSRGYFIRRELALELVDRAAGPVLEAGCGPGIIAPALSEKGLDVHGADLSFEQLRSAAAKDGGSLYLQADLEALPYRDAVFGTVVILGVFEYLERPLAVLQEIRRVTTAGGRLILSAANSQAVPRLWTQYVYIPLSRTYKRARGRPVPSYSRTLYSADALRSLLEHAGFCIRTVRYFDLEPTLPPFQKLAPKATLRLAEAVEKRFGGGARRVLASQFLVVAEAERR